MRTLIAATARRFTSVSSARPHLAVVIAHGCEAGDLTSLVDATVRILRPRMRFEIVIVDDACGPGVAEELAWIAATYKQVMPVSHGSKHGESAALCTAVRVATAPVIAILDGRGSHDPADLPALYARLDLCPSLSMVEGVATAADASSINHRMRRAWRWLHRHLPGIEWPLDGDGPVMFYRSAFLRLPVRDDMHSRLASMLRGHGYDTDSVAIAAHRCARQTPSGMVGPPGH